jgi:hypothetical protein
MTFYGSRVCHDFFSQSPFSRIKLQPTHNVWTFPCFSKRDHDAKEYRKKKHNTFVLDSPKKPGRGWYHLWPAPENPTPGYQTLTDSDEEDSWCKGSDKDGSSESVCDDCWRGCGQWWQCGVILRLPDRNEQNTVTVRTLPDYFELSWVPFCVKVCYQVVGNVCSGTPTQVIPPIVFPINGSFSDHFWKNPGNGKHLLETV